jgi:transcription elongation factor Elf1
MKTLRCPHCENELTEAQIHVKPTKNPQWVKVRCGICRHAWKVPVAETGQKPVVLDGLVSKLA